MKATPPCDSSLNDASREAFSQRQRRGLHFIAAATGCWLIIAVLQLVVPGALTRNLVTFMVSCLLLPGAWLLARVLHVPFQDSSPWAKLGMLFSVNQALYLPIALWVYPTVPDRLVMVLGVITAAHLLPFGWLYSSRAYTYSSIIGTVAVFVVGVLAPPAVTAALIACVLMVLAVSLTRAR